MSGNLPLSSQTQVEMMAPTLSAGILQLYAYLLPSSGSTSQVRTAPLASAASPASCPSLSPTLGGNGQVTFSGTYDYCETSAPAALLDGTFSGSCTPSGFSLSSVPCGAPSSLTIGSASQMFLIAPSSPATVDQIGSQTGSFSLTYDPSTSTIQNIDLSIVLYGTDSATGGGNTESFQLGTDAAPFQVQETSTASTVNLQLGGPSSGAFVASGSCGSGNAVIQTLSALQIPMGSIAPTAGQLQISSGGVTATLTYNADGSITIVSGDGTSGNYTPAQIAAACVLSGA